MTLHTNIPGHSPTGERRASARRFPGSDSIDLLPNHAGHSPIGERRASARRFPRNA